MDWMEFTGSEWTGQWRRKESAANRSPIEFPANTEEYREFCEFRADSCLLDFLGSVTGNLEVRR
jgi:hypothetical protein